MQKKLVSIIMPTYNSANTISKTIASILLQSYENIQLIIVDDGSKDETADICKKINDERIIYKRKENGGPSSARNLGLQIATGEYIMFIDSDDEYEKETVSTMVNAMEEYDCDCVVGNYFFNDEKVKVKCKKDIINFDRENFIYFLLKNKLFNVNWNKIYKKDIIAKNKITFNEKYKLGEDIRFNYDYFKYLKKGIFINEYIYHYYFTSAGLTLKNQEDKNRREVELLQYQYEYFCENNLDKGVIARKIATSIFFIKEVDFIMNNQIYLNLLEKVHKNDFLAYILYFLITKKCQQLVAFLINLRGR